MDSNCINPTLPNQSSLITDAHSEILLLSTSGKTHVLILISLSGFKTPKFIIQLFTMAKSVYQNTHIIHTSYFSKPYSVNNTYDLRKSIYKIKKKNLTRLVDFFTMQCAWTYIVLF